MIARGGRARLRRRDRASRPASARSSPAAGSRRELRDGGARRTGSRSAARTATGSSPSPRARRSGATRSRRSSPGAVAMVSQSGNVAVNALGSRRGIRFHTVVSTGNQAVCDASDWLAALASADGVRSVALFLEADGDGARLAEALAICAERGIGVAVLKVGASEAGARAASAHTGALAGDQRVFRALVEEAGGAWAEDSHELLELARALGRAAGAATAAPAGSRCSPARAATRVSPPTRPRGWASSCPSSRRRRASGSRSCCPEAATIAQPARLHVDDLGRRSRCSPRSSRRSAPTPRSTSCCSATTIPHDAGRVAGRRSATGWPTARRRATRPRSSPRRCPDLLDADAARELSDAGLPAIAGLRTALACARALRAAPADRARLREIAASARVAVAPTGADGWVGEAEAKALAAGARGRGAGRVGRRRRRGGGPDRGGDRLPGGAKLSAAELPHKSDVGGLALGVDDEGALREAFARLVATAGGVRSDGAGRGDGGAGPRAGGRRARRRRGPGAGRRARRCGAEVLDDVASCRCRPSCAGRAGAAAVARGPALVRRTWAEWDRRPRARRARGQVGQLLLEKRLSLVELNPVIATPDGAVAVDALARPLTL